MSSEKLAKLRLDSDVLLGWLTDGARGFRPKTPLPQDTRLISAATSMDGHIVLFLESEGFPSDFSMLPDPVFELSDYQPAELIDG